MSFLLRAFFSAILLLTGWSAAGAATGDRVALVIGNGAYRQVPLPNPSRDAAAMSALLTQAGFAVDLRVDAKREQLVDAVAAFGRTLRDPKVKLAVFYYAGHGVQLDWRNYLIPVDSAVRSVLDIRQQAVDLSELLKYMSAAEGKTHLVILDACRDDPFGGQFKVAHKGLSQFDAPARSLLAYATAPGRVAYDGEGGNGLYTTHLLQELAVRGARIEDAFKRIRIKVRLASRGRQIPWESTSLEDDVALFPVAQEPRSQRDLDGALEAELKQWTRVRRTGDVDQLGAFLTAFPSGHVSELAMARFNRLLAENPAADKTPGESEPRATVPAPRSTTTLPATEPPAQTAIAPTLAPATVPAPAAAQAEAPAQTQTQTQSPVQPAVLASTPYFRGSSEFERHYAVGDLHAYQVIDRFNRSAKTLERRVSAVDVANDRVEFDGGQHVTDLMGNSLRNDRGEFDMPRQFYPAELTVGRKWRTRFKQSRANGDVFTFDYELRIAARERITVPAGSFDAYRIEARGFNVELGALIVRTIWVAPGISADVAHETEVRLRSGVVEQFDRMELVGYQARESRSR